MVLLHVCNELSLTTKAQVIYQGANLAEHFLCDDTLVEASTYEEGDVEVLEEALCEISSKRLGGDGSSSKDLMDYEDNGKGCPSIDVKWVTPFRPPYPADEGFPFGGYYGNEAGVDWVYSTMCLLVQIPKASERVACA